MSAVPGKVDEVGRFRLLGWTFVLAVLGSLSGVFLVSVLPVFIAGIALFFGISLMLLAVPAIHYFADWHRRQFTQLVGVEIPRPYRPTEERGWLRRLVETVRDPANVRDPGARRGDRRM